MQTLIDILLSPIICIGWLIAGAIAGAVANRIMGGSNQPILIDIITGLVGAGVGNVILSLLDINRARGGFDGFLVTIVVGIIGAVVVIAILRALRLRR